MIEFIGVSKAFHRASGASIILDDVTLRISPRARMGILAKGQSGKSTVVRLIAGVEQPDRGSIRCSSRISWPLGFAGGFHPSLTGDENVRIIARLYGVDADEISIYCYHFSELGPDYYHPLTAYSSGMRAQLSFSLSMAFQFDCYVADELVGVGNRAFREKCAVALEERLRHAGILLFSKTPRTVERFCTRFGVLSRGRIALYETFRAAVAAFEAQEKETAKHG